ncbi:MAG: hypothetical protein J0G95_01560 [Rhizobiales bacterium]|nr:hypothetical protein [Hyphomicrobiales bacterium]
MKMIVDHSGFDVECLPPAPVLDALLLESLQALAAAGQPEAACRLAGRACAALRNGDSRQWRKFNALLHRLSPMVADDKFDRDRELQVF